MRILWLEIEAQPTRVICRDSQFGDVPSDPLTPKHGLLLSVEPLRSESSMDAPGQTANFAATLENKSGAVTRLFEFPPLAAKASLWVQDAKGTRLLYAGLVQTVVLGTTAKITVQS